MKKILLMLPLLLYWSCEEEQEPEDCAGVRGGNNICGCIDTTATNYDSTATYDDGSCTYPPVYGVDLNEFLASSELCCGADLFDEGVDFIELYNNDTVDLDISGWGFSDDQAASGITIAPDGTVFPAGGYLVVWYTGEADGWPQIDQKLDGGGDVVYVQDADGKVVISYTYDDSFDYDDVTANLLDDGTYAASATPTPGAVNIVTTIVFGCTDPDAENYDADANVDDGSCDFSQTYNYFDTSYNLKHPDLWLDYYAIPVANGLPLNGVDSEGNTFPFWYDAAVAIADFNGDGFEDILHSKTGSDLVTEEYPLELFINDGSNEIFIIDNTLIPDNAKNTSAREAAIGDFNNDGKPDVFYATHGIHPGFPGEIPSILLSTDTGYSFSKLESLFNPFFYHSLASGDVNNDGYLDVVIIAGGGENGVLTLLNTGNANFVLNESFFIQDETYGMWSNTLFDINEDGYLELIVTGCFNVGRFECVLIGIYWGNGQYFTDGNFTLVSQGTLWTDFIGDVAIADINGDGKEEIIGRYHDDGVNEKIMIYKHDGDYNYTDVTDTFIENNTNTTGRSMVWIRAQDIDNDGFMDVFNSDKGNSNIGNTQRWEWNGSILERQ